MHAWIMDTTLSLEMPGASIHGGKARKLAAAKESCELGPSLELALGKSPSQRTGCSAAAGSLEDEDVSTVESFGFRRLVPVNQAMIGRRPAALRGDLLLSLSYGTSESAVTGGFFVQQQGRSNSFSDEGSASSCLRSGCSILSFGGEEPAAQMLVFDQGFSAAATATDVPGCATKRSTTTTTCTSGVSNKTPSSSKTCHFQGCPKGARGASGLCIAHGGGRRCQREGCRRGAEGRTIFCKAHGGGRRCQHLGCTKSAEGCTDYCIRHGGGRRCSHEGCPRAARGKSGLCIKHGGGKRCQREGCKRSAEGLSGLCIAHGGGRRCVFPGCPKGAQGSTMYCKAHGGGKRCTAIGCGKGAEGSTPFCKAHGGGKRCSFEGGGVCPKSVHGGTLFCVAHGGGKRCLHPGCGKSARGRTNHCVRHGGGKRCMIQGCPKSAQGRTDFCKAHGGGTRCSWGQADSLLGSGDTPCDRFARGRTGLCSSHSAIAEDRRVHGAGSLGWISGLLDSKGKAVAGEEDIEQPSLTSWESSSLALPEGRVHGGGLMELLAKSREDAGNRMSGGVGGAAWIM